MPKIFFKKSKRFETRRYAAQTPKHFSWPFLAGHERLFYIRFFMQFFNKAGFIRVFFS